MARRRGRRGRGGAAPSDSDSVGRTGAALPEQEMRPIRPEYPGAEAPPAPRPASTRPPRAQHPQAAEQSSEVAPQRGRRSRRRRGRGGSRAPVAAGAASGQPAATLAERLPEAVETAPHSHPAAAGAPAFAPEISAPAPHSTPAARPAHGVVVLAIGLPGSGKSTWFKRRGVTPLSSDLLRTILFDDITEQRYQGLVFSTLRSLLRARLIAKMPWNYVDATNLSSHER